MYVTLQALLHFIYSDTLAEDDNCLVVGYAFGPCVSKTFGAKLLAAADTWNLHRLKSICESHLWKSISLGCFVEILSLAGKHNASELKHLCFKYGVDNYGGKRFVGLFELLLLTLNYEFWLIILQILWRVAV